MHRLKSPEEKWKPIYDERVSLMGNLLSLRPAAPQCVIARQSELICKCFAVSIWDRLGMYAWARFPAWLLRIASPAYREIEKEEGRGR